MVDGCLSITHTKRVKKNVKINVTTPAFVRRDINNIMALRVTDV